MPARPPMITKSKYMNGLQCHKLLWYACNEPSRFPPTDPATQAMYDQGHEINKLAQSLYPGGVLIEWNSGFSQGLSQTSSALASLRPVFEAGFLHNNHYCRIDILQPAASGGWNLIEVKSSTQVKPEHLQDIAFQLHLCEQLKIDVKQCFLMLVDPTYVRRGPVDASRLLKIVDVTRETEAVLPAVLERLPVMRLVISEPKSPDIAIGSHCNIPYPCALKKMCWANVPSRNVFTLKSGGKLSEELMKSGIVALKDIPAGIELTRHQAIQVECEKTVEPHVEPEEIRTFLDQLRYPIYLLDFETISPAIPVYDLSRPYQQIPFQYSLHVIRTPGDDGIHTGYLHCGKDDPRPEILKRLREELGAAGSIVAYNAKFEMMVLNDASEFYPEYRNWYAQIIPRFADLYQPFKAFHYYHPTQNGSASLKVVMPALIGTSYAGLEIGAGAMASQEFFRITFGKAGPEECAKVRCALEEYCKQDTEGLIHMLRALERIARGGPVSVK